jgi:serine/threonine-protein kinase RsbW
LRAVLSAAGTSERAAFQAELAFEELVTNVMRHAYAGCAPGRYPIDIVVQIDASDITVTVEDEGPPFDIVHAPDQPLPASIEAARIGGLGLRFIRAAAKRLVHERIGNRNRVTVCIDRH